MNRELNISINEAKNGFIMDVDTETYVFGADDVPELLKVIAAKLGYIVFIDGKTIKKETKGNDSK